MRNWQMLMVVPLLLCGASVSAATDDATPPPAAAQSRNDPNKIICETQEVIGSRLATKRVCATRAQWAERRLQERLQIDQSQRVGESRGK